MNAPPPHSTIKAVFPAERRSKLTTLRYVLRNPLEGWPEEVYRAPMLRTRTMGHPTLFVMDPDLIREVMVEKADAFHKDPATKRALGPALGRGILTADGQHWRWQRRLASPVFRHENVLTFLPAIVAAAERTRDEWAGMDGRQIDVLHAMMRTTFDIIIQTMLAGAPDMDVDRVAESITAYLRTSGWAVAMALLRAPRWMPYPGRGRARRSGGYLRDALGRAITARRASGTLGNDLTGLLLAASDPETGQKMEDRDIIDNLLTFIAAGHETTSLALSWSFYLLSQHPEIEAKVLSEIAAVAPDGVSPEHIEHLVYTRQVVQEAMRLYPPASVLVRLAVADLTIGAEVVPAGTTVIVPVFAIHHHQALWAEPDRFDPDRFSPEAVKARHRYAYIPFGAGPRICIGMGFALLEATAILATLIARYRLCAVRDAPPRPLLRVTLRPEGGMPMRIERRALQTS